MTLPIFILHNVPGATGHPYARKWEDICHGQQGKKFLLIAHRPHRSPSRHTYAENKRPFRVEMKGRGFDDMNCGQAESLAGALKIAARTQKAFHPPA